MGLRAFYATKEDIPEDQQSLYVEKDGKWMLDVDAVEGVGLADANGLKSALQKERTRADNAEKKLKTFDGIEDADAARSAMKKLAELGDLDAIEDLDEKHKQQLALAKSQAEDAFNREKAKLEAKYNEDLGSVRKQLDGTQSQLRKELVRNAAMRAVEKHGGAKSLGLLLPFIESRTLVEPADDGTMKMKMIGDNGQPLTTAALGSVEDMGMEEFVGMLKQNQEFASAFAGNQASGSGAGSGSGSGGGTGGTGGAADPNTLTFKRSDLRNPEKFQQYKDARAAQDAGKGPGVQVVDG